MSITIANDYYTLDFSNYDSFYSRRSHSPVGAAPHVKTPKAGGCMISRFIHHLIIMNKVDRSDIAVVYSVGGGKRLVAWKQENEEICVDFSKLIGFSSGIKFKLLVAITPGALACSTILTGCAVGTGLLLFEADGPPISCDSYLGIFAHDKLIAWSRSSAFEFNSHDKFLDCYFGATYLKPTNEAKFIIDSDTEKRGISFLLAKFLKKIYLP
jgi:hypothetical protein